VEVNSPNPPLVYRGAKEIAAAVGINYKQIRHYVDDKGLPAFRIDDAGHWIALPDDLLRWVKKQRDQCLNLPKSASR